MSVHDARNRCSPPGIGVHVRLTSGLCGVLSTGLAEVHLLAGLDGDRQAVLGGRQRARGIGREDTGRVVSLVEIEVEGARRGWPLGVQKAPAAICVATVGGVPEDDEETTLTVGEGVQALSVAVDVGTTKVLERLGGGGMGVVYKALDVPARCAPPSQSAGARR